MSHGHFGGKYSHQQQEGTSMHFALFNTLFQVGAALFTIILIVLLVVQVKYQVLTLRF